MRIVIDRFRVARQFDAARIVPLARELFGGDRRDLTGEEAGCLRCHRTLELDGTAVTDKGMGQLRGLTGLRFLRLEGTAVTDGGIAQLAALEHLRREVGDDWWRSPKTGEILRALFAEGTKPSSEEIAARLGFEPYDTAPLIAELTQ